ncbi:hypothetical protein HDV62DRAFT_268042 [Trichoderma sp. SZMC 28011]
MSLFYILYILLYVFNLFLYVFLSFSPSMMAIAGDCFVLSLICFFPYMLLVLVPLEHSPSYLLFILLARSKRIQDCSKHNFCLQYISNAVRSCYEF